MFFGERIRSRIYHQRLELPAGQEWRTMEKNGRKRQQELIQLTIPATHSYYVEARRSLFQSTYRIITINKTVMDKSWRGQYRFNGKKDSVEETIEIVGLSYSEVRDHLRKFDDEIEVLYKTWGRRIDQYHYSHTVIKAEKNGKPV